MFPVTSAESMRDELSRMDGRSVLFQLVMAEMKVRGRWKNLDRGAKPPKTNAFRRLSIQEGELLQVRLDRDGFSEGI